jgi:uncharacterized delta-60 repeat protein
MRAFSFFAALSVRAVIVFAAVGACRAQSLDLAFNPNANGEIYAIVAQPDGRLLVGGNLSTIDGAVRGRFARLNASGSVDPSLNVSFNSTVWTIALQADGKILVGGAFTAAGTATRNRLARLNADGTLDPTFSPMIDSTVRAVTVQPDGRILVAGLFSTIGGVPRTGLARLNADGSIDPSFEVTVSGALLVATFMVEGLALQPDGRILFCGNFNTVAGQPRTAIARLLPSGVLDLSFVPPTLNSNMRTMIVLPGGKTFLAGNFSRQTAPILNYTARLNSDGSLDSTFTPPILNGSATGAALQADGKLVVGGFFTIVGGVSRGSLIRLNADGTLDPTFDPRVSGTINGPTGSPNVNVVVVPPGPAHVVVGGAFAAASGQSRSALARFGTPLPVLSTQPTSVIGAEGARATLSAATLGEDVRYQWKRNGVDVPGATIATLTLAGLQQGNTGIYTLAVSNVFGTTTTDPISVVIGPAQAPGYTFTTLAGSVGNSGGADGTAANARFSNPTAVALDSSGALFAIDSNGLRRITPAGSVSTLASSVGQSLAVDSTGNIYSAGLAQVRKYTATGAASTLAGSILEGSRDGTGGNAQFGTVTPGAAVDRNGVLYITDTRNLAIRRITPAGVVNTFARVAPASTILEFWGVAVDHAGTVYFTDYAGGGVGQVSSDGTVFLKARNLSVLADIPAPPQLAERLTSIAVDAAGNLFVTDALNHVVRRIDVSGKVSTVGGARGSRGSVDGPGETARFSAPYGVAVDAEGTLYLSDNGNHTLRKGVRETVPLGIVAGPTSVHGSAGAGTMLHVAANGRALRFQWQKDGVDIVGATTSTYMIARAAGSDMGYYRVAVSSGGTTIESGEAILTVETPGVEGRIVNVSTRGFVPAGGALTPGFVLRGTGTKRIVARAVGPTLLRFGLGESLADPRLDLFPFGGSVALAGNDDWGTGGAMLGPVSASVGAFALDSGAKDAGLLADLTLGAGNAYTARVTATSAAASGIALAEIYDADALTAPAQLVNVSTRGFVGTGATALVPGFVIGGAGPKQLLIRAVGPGLAPFGVSDLLADPQISVIPSGRVAPVAANDNWSSDLSTSFAAVGAFPLTAGSRDAAVLVRLPPGGYTVVVSGVGNTTGTALVEIYDVP